MAMPFSIRRDTPTMRHFQHYTTFLTKSSATLPRARHFVDSSLCGIVRKISCSLVVRPGGRLRRFVSQITSLVTTSRGSSKCLCVSRVYNGPSPHRVNRGPCS